MPKTKLQKIEIIKKLQDNIKEMKSVVFVNFFGIPVKEISQLRQNCKDQEVEYVVAKKTLLKKVLSESGYQAVAEKNLSGEIAAVFGKKDEISPSKLIFDFVKSHEKMKVVAGILDGRVINADEIMALAKLPSKSELLAKIVGSIVSPLSGLVNVLQGNIRGLVFALNAIKEKKL
ncbi:MAG: 50S ribosomal protein L10 [Patescibacteria group bacterium]